MFLKRLFPPKCSFHFSKMDPSKKTNSEALLKKLENLKISFNLVNHEPVTSCKEHSDALNNTNLAFCKNLLILNKKSKKLSLLVLPAASNFSFKQIGSVLGVNGNHLRLANDALLEETLKVARGALNPFSVMFDSDDRVELIIDKPIAKEKRLLAIHPMHNDASILVKFGDLKTFLEDLNKPFTEISFGDKIASETKLENLKKTKNRKALAENDKKGISCRKTENFSQWYSELVTKSEMVDYYDVSGCYILRPNSCFIWNRIKSFFDEELSTRGVEEAYFPMFVTKTALEAEESHIEGFKPEVAWVTRSGESELSVPLAIRPTSETIMYPSFKNWVRSHRDLPLRINQWSNVVRWEFKNPTPFIRTREFLWQEGHSAFETKAQADDEVLDILDIYSRVYEDLLAVPVIKGRKTEVEKFPGADFTTTVETFIPETGRSIQGATSHALGQNFGKIFKIEFEDESRKKKIPFQNSWGLTTRSIGAMLMMHGDDKGAVLPPKVARHQVVIVPIFTKRLLDSPALFRQHYMDLLNVLRKENLRAIVDERRNYNPGWKYNHWELKGVPLRVEFGPKDLERRKCVLVRRDDNSKAEIDLHDAARKIGAALEEIQKNLYRKASEKMDRCKREALHWSTFENALKDKCFAEVPFCNEKDCEESVKERSHVESDEKSVPTGSAKSLCVPFAQKKLPRDIKCFACDRKAVNWTLFGRSY